MTSRATSVRPRPRRAVRHLLVGLTVALVAALTPTGATAPAQAAPTLLSQGKPATASSTENAGTPASAAVDGNTGTRWSSAFSDPQWLQVDLGARATISQVVLQLGGRLRPGLPDPDLRRRRHLDDDLLHHHRHRRHPDAHRHRHRPLRADERHRAGHRLRLLAVGVPGLRRDRRHHADLRHAPTSRWASPATASSTENAGTPASAAVDGNTGTRWSSAASDPQWLQRRPRQHPHHLPGGAAPGRPRTPGPSRSRPRPTAPPGPRSTPPPPAPAAPRRSTVTGTGRYVRMYGTARATALRLLAVGVRR